MTGGFLKAQHETRLAAAHPVEIPEMDCLFGDIAEAVGVVEGESHDVAREVADAGAKRADHVRAIGVIAWPSTTPTSPDADGSAPPSQFAASARSRLAPSAPPVKTVSEANAVDVAAMDATAIYAVSWERRSGR